MMKADADLKRLQNTLLSMAKETAKILERHEIPYMLAYGTLLGAVRHKGFIPWDDDFDFYLFDETYEKAMEFLRAELPHDMFLEDEISEPLYFHGYAHVKDLNSQVISELFPQDNSYSHKGIFLDLYRTKKMKKSAIENFRNEENKAYIERRWSKGLMTESEYERRIKNLLYDERNAKISFTVEDADVWGIITAYKIRWFEQSDVFPLKKYVFEDYEFYGPNDADSLLRKIYGDYMTLPPVEERRIHYSEIKFF
jgi:lipopolysaccharide cholinephosphotransferase